jgi:urease accessory protein
VTALRTSASGDGVGLVCAWRSAVARDLEALAAIDAAIYVRKLNEETRLMTVRMGRKLSELAIAVLADPLGAAWLGRICDGTTPGTHPASLAATVASMKIGPGDAFAVQQYGIATTILGAALRLMRISFVETQAMLWRVMAAVPATFEEIADATLDDMAGFAPANDILAALHVKGHVRMFMN